MTTKKQSEMISKAIYMVKNSLCEGRAWDDLFENGDNNTNAVILGLIQEIERDNKFAISVHKQANWNGNMPQEVENYAKYKNIVSGVLVPDPEPLDEFLNMVDDFNRFENEPMNREQWKHLNRYYIEPLRKLLRELEDFSYQYCE